MSTTEKPYIPAAGSDRLLPFYDLFTRLLGVESSHRRLLQQAAIRPGYRVLEIGCGTGNLAILARRLNPTAGIFGIDPDPQALSLAAAKAHRAGVLVELAQAYSEQLPFPDAAFDTVLSAFMLHHIPPASKLPALREAYRALKPGGTLHLVDFRGGEHRRAGRFANTLHSPEESRFHHSVPHLMQEAGFADAREVAQQTSFVGRIAYYSAVRPL
jgi:ubiquinone/menaquinone biosynthesis C-methylase UbiE